MDHKKVAESVLQGVGGEENVRSVVHCATRLRFVVKDRDKVDDTAIRGTAGIITTADAGGQYQVVVGNDVPEVFAALRDASSLGGAADGANTEDDAPKGNLFNRFIAMIAAIFTPLLWALAGTGLLKAFLAAAATFAWIDTAGSTYLVLNALSDAFIYFLPIALAVTAATYFKAQQFTSIAIAGALVYPSVVAAGGAADLDFFGIPLTMISYVSSVIPVIVAVWLQSHAEHWLHRVLPSAVRRFLTPMIIVAVLVPLIFLVIGPIANIVSTALADAVGWLFEIAPWLGGAILGGLWQVFVIFGLHWGFVPLFALELEQSGFSLLIAPLFAAVLAQAAATAAVLIRTRSASMRSLAMPATISGFLAGITEPAIYGINLPLKRPFAFGIVGGVLGGALISAGGVAANSFALPSLLALPALLGSGSVLMLVIGLAVAIIVPFLLTLTLGFKEPEEPATGSTPTATDASDVGEDVVVASPLDGTVIPLAEAGDAVFASGALGAGVAIQPREDAVYAPFDGVVVAAFPTGHAIGLRSTAGVELLIHVGIDTVRLDGEHFDVTVTEGQQIRSGDLLVTFDRTAIAAAGYDTTTPVVVTNGDAFPTLGATAAGPIAHGDALFTAVAAQPQPTA